MSTPKDRLESPYKATSAETVDLLTGVAQRMVNSDGPLLAWSQVADVTANGASKYARGDWRTRSEEYFLPKVLRHLVQHYGAKTFIAALHEAGAWVTCYEDIDFGNGVRFVNGAHELDACAPSYDEPQLIDAESGQPHLARAATNILMALENCGNQEDAPAIEPVTAEELGMVYLASPYTVNPELSYVIAREIVESCVKDGVAVYAPTLYGHVAAKNGSYDYWVNHGIKLLEACDSVVFVEAAELGPWRDSKGCQLELASANASLSGKKLYQFNYDTKQMVRL